ncbi:unnamed protein product [Spirodela intermedia]|uniref:Uncharacterized protein n=1 Tax=Spirodela intermedia TaxID=51605 RepID=A0A7I8K852_SPIIN|nr:unnamed protein product [Spirodela intermedia]
MQRNHRRRRSPELLLPSSLPANQTVRCGPEFL